MRESETKSTAALTGRSRTGYALLILDMISLFEFEDGVAAVRAARRITPSIVRLRARAYRAEVPVIYVNDTSGPWESDPRAFVKRCCAADAIGHSVVQSLAPGPGDFFLLKPRHSGFYATPLGVLLESMQVTDIILTGLTSHQCVLFTAMDAYVRNYRLLAPADCMGSPEVEQRRHALFILQQSLRARIGSSRTIRFRHVRRIQRNRRTLNL